MSATKVLDMAEKQGLLDAKAIGELRKQVAESKFVVTAEAIAKVLVDHGHLTAFQARKLVATALGEPEPVAPLSPPPAKPVPPPAKPHESELGLADSSSHDDIVDMKVAGPSSRPPMAKPPAPKAPSRSQAETRPLDVAPRPVPPRSAPSPLVPVSPPGRAPSGLEPIAAPAGAASPLTPVAPPRSASPPPARALQPVDPLSLDVLQAPSAPLAPADQKAKARSVRPKSESPWKNPTYLLLGGGGLLVMFIAFILLYWNLSRTPIAALFTAAGADYDSGSLGGAKEKYTEYLNRTDPKSSDASLARVRLGMIDFRQASSQGRNPKPGIEAANRILPAILPEERFDDCRLELRTILVDMAMTSARAAQAAKTTDKKVELVGQTDEAFKLVDNASYIPSSIRGDVQPLINQALDILKAARRSIDQDKDLAKAIDEMKKATEAKNASQAYQIRHDLIRTYPVVEGDAGLIEATMAVAAMEKAQVKLLEEALAPRTQDEPTVPSVVLSHTTGGESGLAGQFVATLVQGAVYGFDANSGNLLWRRFVGHDTLAWPQPVSSEAGADFLLVDGTRHELIRVKALSGDVVWRLPLGQSFTPPVVAGEQALLNTADGRLVEVNLATGQSQRQLKLPQAPSVSPAYDSREARLLQLGRHSTLFVLDADRLLCSETYYLGHKAGSILVPPITVLGHVLVTESPADDYSLIHTLTVDSETKKLKSLGEPIRLKGRVTVPIRASGQRAVVVTDQGQVKVIQVDPANKARPVRELGTGSAGGGSLGMTYFALTPGHVYVTSDRLSCLEIQAAAGDLKSTRQLHGGDAFVAPPQVLGKVLIHVRRGKSSLATVVEAYQPEENKSLWKTEIADPVSALSLDQGRQEMAVITSRGRVYELSNASLQGAKIEKANYVPLPGTESMSLTEVVELGSGKLALLGPKASPHGLLYDPAATGNRAQQIKFSLDIHNASTPATFFQGGLALPQQTGQVLMLDPANGGQKVQPFQPALVAGQRIAWNRPALLPPDGTDLAVADGLRTIYRLAIRPQPQPHLELTGQMDTDGDIVAPLAASGDTLYAVLRFAANDQLLALQASDLTDVGKIPLAGRVRFGPVSAGGLVFIGDEKNLHALESGNKAKWSQPLVHGGPALAPMRVDTDWIVVGLDGTVSRLSADSGQELSAASIGEPAGRAAAIIAEQIVVAGADGTLHTLPLPK